MTTTREAEWDEQTREAALALALYEESLCPVCGRPQWVCQDAANQDAWRTPDPVRCHAGTALMNKQKGYTEETHSPVAALLFSVALEDGAHGG